MDKVEIEKILEEFGNDFKDVCPQRDALGFAKAFCESELAQRVTKVLNKYFSFRSANDLISFIDYINEKKKQENSGGQLGDGGTGRKGRKPSNS